MDVFTPKTTRRSTRLRVQIPLSLTSLDRMHRFAAKCVALVVSAQGCGIQAPQILPLGTPVMLDDLPGGATATGRVASCLPVGIDGTRFLIGISLYHPGNVWGISDPPADWDVNKNAPDSANKGKGSSATSKQEWPYTLAAVHRKVGSGHK
jgi:hypothetical protein